MTEDQEYFILSEARISQQGKMLRALREAIRPFALIALTTDRDHLSLDMIDGPDLSITPNQVRDARKALLYKGD